MDAWASRRNNPQPDPRGRGNRLENTENQTNPDSNPETAPENQNRNTAEIARQAARSSLENLNPNLENGANRISDAVATSLSTLNPNQEKLSPLKDFLKELTKFFNELFKSLGANVDQALAQGPEQDNQNENSPYNNYNPDADQNFVGTVSDRITPSGQRTRESTPESPIPPRCLITDISTCGLIGCRYGKEDCSTNTAVNQLVALSANMKAQGQASSKITIFGLQRSEPNVDRAEATRKANEICRSRGLPTIEYQNRYISGDSRMNQNNWKLINDIANTTEGEVVHCTWACHRAILAATMAQIIRLKRAGQSNGMSFHNVFHNQIGGRLRNFRKSAYHDFLTQALKFAADQGMVIEDQYLNLVGARRESNGSIKFKYPTTTRIV